MTLVKHSKEIWYAVIYFIKWLLNTEESSLCLIPVQFTCQSHWDYLILFEGLCSSSIIYEWGVFCFQLPNWESQFCILFFNIMNKVDLSQMSKCYSFAFDALKSITKNHEPLLVQYSGSTAHLLDAGTHGHCFLPAGMMACNWDPETNWTSLITHAGEPEWLELLDHSRRAQTLLCSLKNTLRAHFIGKR